MHHYGELKQSEAAEPPCGIEVVSQPLTLYPLPLVKRRLSRKW
jgi:hypothetical protein